MPIGKGDYRDAVEQVILDAENQGVALKFYGVTESYKKILDEYKKVTGIHPNEFVNGRGHHKSLEQRHYQKLEEYKDKLKTYARHIEVCGEQRNSYSKTDHSATFMRVKSDYMGNGQLLPAYNLQAAICANT